MEGPFSPGRLIALGVLLLVLGVVGPMLMVIGLLESTFLLNGASFVASSIGLFLGMLGVAMHSGRRRS